MVPWEELSYLPPLEIAEIQNKRLRYFVRHQVPYIPFYRNMFQKAGLGYNDIRTTDDLQRLPLTSKKDIAPTDEYRARPRDFILAPNAKLIMKHASFGRLAGILFKRMFGAGEVVMRDLEYEYKPVHLHFTTGRTSDPVPFAYSSLDLETIREAGRRFLDIFGVSGKESVVNAFPFSPHLAFWQTYFATTASRLTALQTGGGKIMGTEKIAKSLESLKAGVFVSMPGYAYHVLKEARNQSLDLSSLKHIIFGGERVSDGLRKRVRKIVEELGARDVKIMATYAFTEGKTAWPQCHPKSGYHTYPDLEFIEVVDEDGQRLPPGNKGEVVYTSLGWRGTVVMRYRTGDITDGLYFDKCEHCGRTVPRIDPRIERKSEFEELQLTKVKGKLINMNLFFPTLSGQEYIDEWQVEIRKRDNDPYGLDELVVYVAPSGWVGDLGVIARQTEGLVYKEIGVTPKVVIMGKKEIEERLGIESELKEKRIIDLRPKK